MEKIIINADRAKRVLNFKFKTNMLFKCINREYAEDLLNGNIFFNTPEKWIEIEEKSKRKGQGDSLEGTCLITKADDDSGFILKLKNDLELENFCKGDKIYFRRKKIKKLYCYCLYGANDNSFNKLYEDRFGIKYNYLTIDKSYFSSFTDLKSKEEYFNIPVNKRPVVVFISNPHSFFERIREALVSLGLKKEEIIISPIEYVDKNQPAVALLPYPHELLLKDESFDKQSEIRIIINSENQSILKRIKDNNQKINIGKINDIAEIYDFYFEDLTLMKDGNKILFNLSIPQIIPYEELTLRELIEIWVQTLNDTLPDPMPIEKREEIIDKIKKVINEKYSLDINIEDGKFVTHNININIDELLDK